MEPRDYLVHSLFWVNNSGGKLLSDPLQYFNLLRIARRDANQSAILGKELFNAHFAIVL